MKIHSILLMETDTKEKFVAKKSNFDNKIFMIINNYNGNKKDFYKDLVKLKQENNVDLFISYIRKTDLVNFIMDSKNINYIKFRNYIIYDIKKTENELYNFFKKLYFYVFDYKKGVAEKTIKKYAKLVYDNCQPFLKEIDFKPNIFKLYRGIKGANKPILKKRTRLNDRIPKDTSLAIHNYLNKRLEKLYGKPFRNALFAIGNDVDAAYYGETKYEDLTFHNFYLIFPIGNFDYLWSKSVYDLYPEIEDVGDDDAIDFIDEFYIPSLVYNTDLTTAIARHKEIMIWCKEYYAINYIFYGKEFLKELTKLIES